jgi:hypothetical protein
LEDFKRFLKENPGEIVRIAIRPDQDQIYNPDDRGYNSLLKDSDIEPLLRYIEERLKYEDGTSMIATYDATTYERMTLQHMVDSGQRVIIHYKDRDAETVLAESGTGRLSFPKMPEHFTKTTDTEEKIAGIIREALAFDKKCEDRKTVESRAVSIASGAMTADMMRDNLWKMGIRNLFGMDLSPEINSLENMALRINPEIAAKLEELRALVNGITLDHPKTEEIKAFIEANKKLVVH